MDTTLFILFGRGADGALSPSLVTINVTNATNILYTANYESNSTDHNSDDSSSNKPSSDKPGSSESGGLSKGAIAGIAVGATVIVSKNKVILNTFNQYNTL